MSLDICLRAACMDQRTCSLVVGLGSTHYRESPLGVIQPEPWQGPYGAVAFD